MTVAQDASPLEVYRRLPPRAEPELVAEVVPHGATLLELGAGAGRLTRPLVAVGYRVTAVDNSPEMLVELAGVETALVEIETLELGRRFDCVLLASHFINEAVVVHRHRMLRTCARHVASDGVVLIEAYPPDLEWARGSRDRTRRRESPARRSIGRGNHGPRDDGVRARRPRLAATV